MKYSAFLFLGIFCFNSTASPVKCEAVPIPQLGSIQDFALKLPESLLKPRAWTIPYYDRPLNNAKPYEMLCITSRDGTSLTVLGHTALSRFKLDESSQAHEVTSIGLWPLSNLLINSHKDHFLNFEQSQEKRKNVSFCVPINKTESKRLNDFLEERKNIRWSLGYNCNDFSTEAFKLITGIDLESRTASTMLLSNPVKVRDSITKMLETQSAPKAFMYAPKGRKEINKLVDLELNQKLMSSPFKNN